MERRFRVSVLGPLVVDGPGGPVDLGPVRRRALFAVLVLAEGSWCTKQALLDAVWGGSPPPTGGKVIASYVYALRRILDGPGVAPADSVLIAGVGGYRLAEGAVQDDAAVAAQLAEDAALAHDRGDPEAARDLLRGAEELWRGEPLATLPGPFAQAQRTRLTELHTERVARRLDLDLELGDTELLIPELRQMLAADPTAEATAGRLMRALHLAGRRSEALTVYESTRRAVQRELGVQPAVALQVAHQDVLAGDNPSPRPEAGPRPPERRDVPERPWTVRCDLPAEPAGFVGRDTELDRLCAEPADAGVPVVRLLDGMGGAGKTTLALRVAHRIAERYPDGQLFVDLHGHTPGREPADPSAVLGRLLRRVGVPEPAIPGDADDLAALWRATVAGRRLLLLLDNAATAAQVRPLLPGGAGCQVLITSRERLADLDAETVGVGMLAEDEAVSLFGTLAPDGAGRADLLRVVRACGYLPLALRVAAARLRNRPGWTAADLADRLADGNRPFAELGGADSGVHAAFAESYAGLPAAQQAMFRALGVLPSGRFDGHVAAAAAGATVYDGEDLLGGLIEANLLGQDHDGHYHLHDLLRRYAQLRQAERSRDERVLVDARVLDYYLHTVHTVKELAGVSGPSVVRTEHWHVPPSERKFDDAAEALAWVGAEFDNVVALLGREFDDELVERVWRSINEWYMFSERHSRIDAFRRLTLHGLATARRVGSTAGEQAMNARAGTLFAFVGAHRLARSYLERALCGAQEIGSDPYAEMYARIGLAVCDAAAARLHDVIRESGRVVELATEHGHRSMLVSALSSKGLAQLHLGLAEDAIRTFTAACDAAGAAAGGPHFANLGAAYLGAGELAEAQRALQRALAEFGEQHADGRAYVQAHLGALHAERGEPELAVEVHRQSLENLASVADRRIRSVAHRLYGTSLLRLGRADEAAEHYAESLRVAGESELVGELVASTVGLARCHDRAGRAAQAERYWTDAGELSAGLELPVRAEILEHLGG